jgi:hypothetical protein
VSNVACSYAMSATHVREPVNADLREARRPSFGSVQIAQGSVKIRLSHERRQRVQTRAERLAYCILAHRHERPAPHVRQRGGTGTRVRARLRNAPRRASFKYSTTATAQHRVCTCRAIESSRTRPLLRLHALPILRRSTSTRSELGQEPVTPSLKPRSSPVVTPPSLLERD